MKRNMNRTVNVKSAAAVIFSTLGIVLALPGCAAGKNVEDESGISEDNENTESIVGEGQSIEDIDQPAGTDLPDKPTDSELRPEDEAQTPAPEVQKKEPVADSKSLYEQFISGEIAASVSSSYPDPDYTDAIIQKGNSYTLTELGQRVSDYFLDPEYTDKTSYDSIQYAYIECPDSPEDDRNLLVKFIGLNIYTQDDDSYAVFVITEDNGQLSITYTYQCWARSASIANSNGVLNNSGSGGAGDHYDGQSVILANGTNAPVYDAEVLYGWWTSYVDAGIYSEVFGAETEPSGLIVAIYTIDNERYYLYDLSECTEEDKVLCESYITKCREEQGINWVTEEEIQTAIRNRCSAIGIDYGITEQQQEVTWNDL